MPKTMIIATFGPAIDSFEMLKKLAINGVDVIRFNFSHSDYQIFDKALKIIEKLNKQGFRLKALADLKGNRIRIRNIQKPFEIKNKDTIILTKKNVISTSKIISFDYEYDLKAIKVGHKIYIDDGNIELEVVQVNKEDLKTIVKRGGIVKNKKGINIPLANLYFPMLNPEDKKDIDFIIDRKFDFIAQSFVRNHYDIIALRKILIEKNKKIKIISKIENRQALTNYPTILKHSDGIMVARGDLGISVPLYKIPLIQKNLIEKARELGRFSIVATQIFESMVNNYRPTRAEVSDLANAILDGADYVMFSAETAVGRYPDETVRIAESIIRYTEKYILNKK
ncbi:MAG: pyruvate kinase [Elusimicrobiota bacterium]